MHSRRVPKVPEVLLVLAAALGLLIPGGCKKNAVTNPQAGPTAGFAATPLSGVRPLDVDFTDQSTPGSSAITSGQWSFGDGTTGPWPSTTNHIYGSAGTYTVSLTVSTAAGSDTETKTNYVTVTNDTVSTPPTAQFTGAPTSGRAPLLVQFTDHSIAGSSPITSRSWTFGDGGTSTATNPSHSYASAGSYTVSLTVTTTVGPNTQTKTGYILVCAAPVANFTGAPTVGVPPLTVVFLNQSTGATSYSWNFGDGGTSTMQSPSHTYLTAGTYAVRLIAQNACAPDTTTRAGYITVADACSNPVYSVTSASWTNKADADSDGYVTRARLTWGTNVSGGCTKSVFAKIYSRPQGGATWTLVTSSPCYSVPGRAVNYSLFIEGLPMNCYDFRIAVFECGGTTEKAAREPTDDADLTNQCFELP